VLRPTILIVDDHDDGRDMLVEYFRSHAYATVAADAARRAARICRESARAIVVVDLSLPTLDAACRLIRTIAADCAATRTSNQLIVCDDAQVVVPSNRPLPFPLQEKVRRERREPIAMYRCAHRT
jgi:CheY-like chemotaxis protein